MAAATATAAPAGHTRASPPHEGLFASLLPIHDDLDTETSRLQQETVEECLPFLTGGALASVALNGHGLPHLDRARHISFLHKQLGKLPGAFKSADPSRPWFFYWCLAGLSLLGEDVGTYRSRLVATARTMQNTTGGFAGGFGQMSHLATTYATILALTMVGGEDAYDVVDRKNMWKWLCTLKQPDGGFQMAVGGEEDVRYAGPVPILPSSPPPLLVRRAQAA
jgi:protein farnesyltransferase subunit beta